MTANPTILDRADIAKIAQGSPKIRAGLESAFAQIASTAKAVGTQTEATSGIQSATVLVLSANDAFANERILEVDGEFLSIKDTGSAAVIALLYPISLQGGFRCQFDLIADTELSLPSSGTVLTDDSPSIATPLLTGLVNAVNDAAAATAGVPINGVYRNGSALQVRVT